MTPERWKQIETLYFATLDQGEEERARLLAEASPEIRSVVREMLARQSSSILDRPAMEDLTQTEEPEE